MNDFTAMYLPALLAFSSILLLAAALVIKAWRDGSLKADLRWVVGYIRLNLAHVKTRLY